MENIDNPELNPVSAEYLAGFEAAVWQLRCGALGVVVPKAGMIGVDAFAALMSPSRPREEFTLKERTRSTNYFGKETPQAVEIVNKTEVSGFAATDGAAMPLAPIATDPNIIELDGFRGRAMIEVLSLGIDDGEYQSPVFVTATITIETSAQTEVGNAKPTAATAFSGLIKNSVYRRYLTPEKLA